MLPEDAEAELSWPHGAAQRAGTMEPPPALSPVFCILLLIPTWEAGLTVLQSPAVLRASPGETVNLSCSFENIPGSMAKATWNRAPGVVLDSDHPFYKGRLNVSHLDLLQKGEATLTLSELEERDSGLYQCQISIHQGESGTGAGTELQVTGRNQSDTAPPPSKPHQQQTKGHGSRGAEDSKSLHYAEIKIQTPGRREHTSNHAQRR
ncbi:natural cytotoxicity triggering receptor 3-like isoform X2 [Chelonia mydas]|uniref:natural cytotoxicity triggering receptor 3-like isoform X2 n=1 Tax=Chelonia mydas TaxID=8469 RepID=UPI001CA99BB1|nr:natural cytotoxicity triggering receptor 3-like isoform X2 [Chelonia mydas]